MTQVLKGCPSPPSGGCSRIWIGPCLLLKLKTRSDKSQPYWKKREGFTVFPADQITPLDNCIIFKQSWEKVKIQGTWRAPTGVWRCSFALVFLNPRYTFMCIFLVCSQLSRSNFIMSMGNLFHHRPHPTLVETVDLAHAYEEAWRARQFVCGTSWTSAVLEAYWGAGQVIPGKEGEVINPWEFVINET